MTPRAWPLLVLLLAGGWVWREGSRGDSPVAQIDATFLEWMAANARGADVPPADAALTLIEINDAVLGSPPKWPLPALEYALGLQALEPFAPAVVAVEPALAFPAAQADQIRILENRALAVPKLLLGCQLGRSASTDVEAETVAGTALPPGLREVRGDLALIPEFDDIVARPAPELAALAPELGPTNLAGAAPRAVPLLFRCRGRVLPGFVLRAALLHLQLTPDRVTVWLGSHIQLGDLRRIPIDESGRMLLDPRAAKRVARLGLDDLLLLASGSGTTATANLRPPAKGGVALFGRTDGAVRKLAAADGIARTPADWLAAGIATIQRSEFVLLPGTWEALLLLIGTSLAGAWIFGCSRGGAIGAAVIGLGIYAMGAMFIFDQTRLWLPLVLPLATMGGAAVLRLLFAPIKPG